MRPQLPPHPDDDRLLELAYGELPAGEARTLRQHLDGCARCREVIDGIAEVRSAFRSVPPGPAPEKGLESLLAYGEQAAAKARSRRGGLWLLGVLSAAAVVGIAWLLIPSGAREHEETFARGPAPASKREAVARLDQSQAPEQGDRARDEEQGSAVKLVVPRPIPEPPAERQRMVKKERPRPVLAEAPATPPAAPEGRAASGEALELHQAELNKLHAQAEAKAKKDVSGLDGAERRAGAGPSKPGRAEATAADRTRSNATAVAGAATAGGQYGAGARAAGVASPPPAAVAAQSPDEARSKAAADAIATPLAGVVASAERDQGKSGAKEPVAEMKASAKSAPKPSSASSGVGSLVAAPAAPLAQAPAMRTAPQGTPEQAARLAEIRRRLPTATGDERKALLLERCELEAALEMRADVVVSCSAVTREFPGTPEAKRASELARGFSLQPPADLPQR